MITLAVRGIRDPTVWPEEHDPASDRIWIRPAKWGAKRQTHLDTGFGVARGHKPPYDEAPLCVIVRPIPGGYAIVAVGAVSFL